MKATTEDRLYNEGILFPLAAYQQTNKKMQCQGKEPQNELGWNNGEMRR